MSRTITGTTTTGITLTSQANNPVSVTGTISVTSGGALTGQYGASNTWTIDNSGLISTSAYYSGVLLGAGYTSIVNGVVTNEVGGTISGGKYGIAVEGPGAVTNDAGGIIVGTGVAGVGFYGLGTVVNAGAIHSGGDAIFLYGGGSATNLAEGTLSGGAGVFLSRPGTVTNAGTITGTNSSYGSVDFVSTTGANRLIVDPGAVFNGNIQSHSGASNTVELAVGNSGTGSLTGFGSSVTNFNTIDFDSGANWSISGNTTGLSGTINGFASTDSIDLTGFAAISRTFASNALTLTNSSNAHATLHIHGSFTTADFTIVSGNSGTGTIITACFASGTHIRTVRGAVDVAKLREGDMIVGLDGEDLPVIWLGHRRVDCARHPRPWDVWPVRVAAHAFGPNRPRRDLRLSPDHAVFVADGATEGGVLIPIRYLINGATVVQEAADAVEYWHVEVPRHAVLLAEGLPCESYLDTGNRAAFDNAGAVVALHPRFGATPEELARRIWDTQACARLVCSGPRLTAARRALIARLPTLGHAITDDPALRIVVDDADMPLQRDGDRLRVALPDDASELRLLSRTGVPAELDMPGGDTRRLGVAVAGLALDGEDVTLVDRRLSDGWLAPEPGLRWTAGDGAIDVRGVGIVELRLAPIALLFHHTDGRERGTRAA